MDFEAGPSSSSMMDHPFVFSKEEQNPEQIRIDVGPSSPKKKIPFYEDQEHMDRLEESIYCALTILILISITMICIYFIVINWSDIVYFWLLVPIAVVFLGFCILFGGYVED